ncbi:hypothetical protein PF002_g1525 [Phytophthora fragariae]|uniref:CCHC-type domain-containing protein n=1 Tax=Phytophthora fragariae TaxID=53985 RepID=A0A6A4ENL8_9STRA|nr:hypothetical protein PF003_g4185 [Phytophthora fragariae]KAE8949111.1 hypothetical protein PF009_g1325 [Phytophthora fragariae]KAE9138992.1 hypothetical protein PF007_g1193 [Phytophthora fragariae]KAE9154999.1 hypothetical protein PF006_g1034 [Phytophthora fragariae]KAE9256927.1 hypothetical protein PF002_g1525 [Phytophthora fragariae]
MAAGAPSGNQQYGGHLGEEAKAYFTGGSRGSGDYNNGGGRGEGSGGYGGGHGFACGRGAGRGGQGLINFGPGEYKPIVQRKAESPCSYCGRYVHWWRECATRQTYMAKMEGKPLAKAAVGENANGPAPTAASGNGQR